MRTSGGRGSTRAKRENVASATARRASHGVASHPLAPTKFKSLFTEQAFLLLAPTVSYDNKLKRLLPSINPAC